MPFCTDTDLVCWEPALFREAAGVAQTLLVGLANVVGTAVTALGVSLTDAGVRPLDVITFADGPVVGAYPIVSVDSDTELTLSVLYDGLFPTDGSAGVAWNSTSGASQAFAIRTFYPLRRVVTQMLLQGAGLDAGDPASEEKVVNPEALRRACVLGTLQMVYSALAASAEEPAALERRGTLYERLYRRAMRGVRVEIDLNGDGEADCVRDLGAIAMVRR